MQPTFSVRSLVAGQRVKVGTSPAILGEEVGPGYVHVYLRRPMMRLVVAKTAVLPSEHSPVPQDFDVLPHIMVERAMRHEIDELRGYGARAYQNLEFVRTENASIRRQLLAQSDYGNEIEHTLECARADHGQEICELKSHHEREELILKERSAHWNDPLENAKSKFREVFHELRPLLTPPNTVWLFTSCSLR